MIRATTASIFLLVVAHLDISSSLSASSRRRWIGDTFASLASLVVLNTDHWKNADAAVPMPTVVDSIVEGGTPRTVNPFVRFDTVSMVPNEYFTEHRSLYGFTERVLDGDTIRIRHVPIYGTTYFTKVPEPLQQRGIANETLIVRLYAVDCPEVAQNKNQVTQPFGDDAKKFTLDLLYHEMVKVTFLRRDQYGRAIAVVETVPTTCLPILLVNTNNGCSEPQIDVSMELAKRGLAELYTGGGAEYNVSIVALIKTHLTRRTTHKQRERKPIFCKLWPRRSSMNVAFGPLVMRT